ncbi:MAG TPA: cytochrome c oxidase accessory protein CcoG [Geminicoccaceae bacterium]|nr:cytochrome c oxidase accessory protein CcoG [Geminicoccaceae bacterium]
MTTLVDRSWSGEGEARTAEEPVLSRREQRAGGRYPGQVEVYPRRVDGRFRRIKWAVLWLLLGIYYLVPWLRWDRGPGLPDQAVLFDIPGRRFYFFALEIWPQEIYFLTGLLVLASLGLFLVTSLFGRIWCGYACPQTVWTDLFMWVERLIEGDRRDRIRLDAQPLTAAKAVKKGLKHAVWLVIAMLTGGALVMYFNDAPTVVRQLATGTAGPVVYLFFGVFTATTYLLAGWARELVCTSMCPWPRIQGGLLDQDSLAVTYRDWRGEPRGPHKKGAGWEGRGDCVACRQCVAVCPTGVDIRDGMQLDCIGCGLCIDACNEVMDKVGRPRELIAWDSARNQLLRAQGRLPVWRLLRPRTLIYGGLFAGVGTLMLVMLVLRGTTGVDVLHDSAPLFVRLADGSIRNGYSLKISNRAHDTRHYTVALAGDWPGAAYRLASASSDSEAPPTVSAERATVTTVRLYVSLPPTLLEGSSTPVTFVLQDRESGERVQADSIFRGPGR